MQLNSGNYLQIDELLNAQELSAILNLINQAGFSDGKSTASDAAAGVKQNKQISAENNFQAQYLTNLPSINLLIKIQSTRQKTVKISKR